MCRRQCGEKWSGSFAAFSVFRRTFRTRLSSGNVPASVQNTHSGNFDQPRFSASVLLARERQADLFRDCAIGDRPHLALAEPLEEE